MTIIYWGYYQSLLLLCWVHLGWFGGCVGQWSLLQFIHRYWSVPVQSPHTTRPHDEHYVKMRWRQPLVHDDMRNSQYYRCTLLSMPVIQNKCNHCHCCWCTWLSMPVIQNKYNHCHCCWCTWLSMPVIQNKYNHCHCHWCTWLSMPVIQNKWMVNYHEWASQWFGINHTHSVIWEG